MGHTQLTIQKDQFYINGKLTYNEIPNSPCAGLLLNARFIQGVFFDRSDPHRFDRFGRRFDPEQNTDELIAALPQWYAAGLRALTVGFQGGGPCFTTDAQTIDANPFSDDGLTIDPACLKRMERILKAADSFGMVVIVSYFYMAQCRFFKSNRAVENAVRTASAWLKYTGYKNVIIEVENEYNIEGFPRPFCLIDPAGITELIQIARKASGNLPCGCSETGGHFTPQVAESSDIILIHGHGLNSQAYYDLIKKAKEIKPVRPIVCNEDSPAISHLDLSVREGVSWGYYNNLTKQEPPTDWDITPGQDVYFAKRMATACGIENNSPERSKEIYLQGLAPDELLNGNAWISLASLYPELIERVDFYRNDILIDRTYEEPFLLNRKTTWLHTPIKRVVSGEQFKAVVYFRDGTIREITKTVQ